MAQLVLLNGVGVRLGGTAGFLWATASVLHDIPRLHHIFVGYGRLSGLDVLH
jgi:hypothetical protein